VAAGGFTALCASAGSFLRPLGGWLADRFGGTRVLGFVLANDPFEGAGFGPLNVYVFLGTMLGLVFAGIYIAVNLACIGFFLRERRDEFNFIKHLIIPIVGVIAMIPAALAVIGGLTIPILNIELPPYETALRFTAPIVGVWMLLGIIVYFVLRARNPEALARVGEVYGGEAAPPDAAPVDEPRY